MSKIVTDKNSLKKRVGTVRPGTGTGIVYILFYIVHSALYGTEGAGALF